MSEKNKKNSFEETIEERLRQAKKNPPVNPNAPSTPLKNILAGESGQMKPSDVIAPYYGNNFQAEVDEAQKYNADPKNRTLLPSTYNQLHQPVPISSPHTGRAGMEGAYFLSNKKGSQIHLRSPQSQAEKEEMLQGVRLALQNKRSVYTPDSAQRWLQTNRAANNQTAGGVLYPTNYDDLQHEMGHAYMVPHPTSEDRMPFGSPQDALNTVTPAETGLHGHVGKNNESEQAMGRFQREYYKQYGRRASGKEFEALLADPKNPSFLSPEGARLLEYGRSLQQRSKDPSQNESRDARLEAISRGLPATVKATPSRRRFFA